MSERSVGPPAGHHLGVLVVAFGAPNASTSAPSGPPSSARIIGPGTRIASSGARSSTSSSTLMRALPESTT